MAEHTEISWSDATFNPWIGCTKVGPGCDNCYAKADFEDRKHRVIWGAGQARSRTSAANWRNPLRWNRADFRQCACGWRGTEADCRPLEPSGVLACPHCLGLFGKMTPSRMRVFCASLADVFDNEVEEGWRIDLFRLIHDTPNLDWILLTKRIGNVRSMLTPVMCQLDPGGKWEHPLPNVWLGATIVNQEEADRDIPKLLATPAAVRFLSMEPLLGPVTLPSFARGVDGGLYHMGVTDSMHSLDIDWVIVGGESGPGARPMHPDWARRLRDQCEAAGVAFHFKQWGEWAEAPSGLGRGWSPLDPKQHLFQDGPEDAHTLMLRASKKDNGRLLDGRTHDDFPEVRHG